MLSKEFGPHRTSQDFADAVNDIEHQTDLLVQQDVELREAWVQHKCPFKVGETLTGNDYSFEGKQFVVEEIGITERYTNAVDYSCKWKWTAVGPILNKNGTAGKKFTRRTIAVDNIRIDK